MASESSENNPSKEPLGANRVLPRFIEEEMKTSYLNYSMSVIVGRALPDARDGLKPVHRRVLYTMYETGLLHNKAFKKSANVVGNCMARYHPHGDAAIYDTLVRLAQDFSLRYPLVIGQGNFGSIDGDAAAAMRYTEAKMHKLAEELIEDIDKDTVVFAPNFDGSTKEPTVFPAKVPNLLINGSSGIAVGMATNMPPHNLREVIRAVKKRMQFPSATVEELMQDVTAPDFPTGGIICGRAGIREAYETGKGKLLLRAKTHVEDNKSRQDLIIDEIPYQVNKTQLIEDIAALVRDKVVQGITDIRDESDRDGMRIVFELKSGANPDVVLNQLFKHSRLQVTFGIINLALVNNQPKVISLPQLIDIYVEHRVEMVRLRTQYDLGKAQDRLHILDGLIIALNDIDSAIRMIKAARSADQAAQTLIANFKLTKIQADSILDMKLQRLTALEQEKIRDEQAQIKLKIRNFEEILSSRENMLKVITQELSYLDDQFGDDRKTQIIEGESDLGLEDLIKPEEVVVTITHTGYVKRLPIDTYRQQRRGGRGIIAAEAKDEDFLERLFVANTHSWLLIFTDIGKVHWLKVFQIPSGSRTARGTAMVNLIELSQGEKVSAVLPVKHFDARRFVFMGTQQGTVKKVALDQFANPRRGGIAAISLDQGDHLVNALLTDGSQDIIIATKDGQAVRFAESDVREMGRQAAGVRGIKVREGDRVIGLEIADEKKALFTVSRLGIGKKTSIAEYSRIGRGGVGVINMKVTDKSGEVVSVLSVRDTDEVMLISRNGIAIRTPLSGVSTIGRNTQGVRVMKLENNDVVVAAAKIAAENGDGSDVVAPSSPVPQGSGSSSDDLPSTGGIDNDPPALDSPSNDASEDSDASDHSMQ
ncbi:DNA gyrase subunit A [Candidatus Woesearchaeota archaeon]|nr:DNA gyrase subunit A [Candidatus Woesearchaeota archaeon]